MYLDFIFLNAVNDISWPVLSTRACCWSAKTKFHLKWSGNLFLTGKGWVIIFLIPITNLNVGAAIQEGTDKSITGFTKSPSFSWLIAWFCIKISLWYLKWQAGNGRNNSAMLYSVQRKKNLFKTESQGIYQSSSLQSQYRGYRFIIRCYPVNAG